MIISSSITYSQVNYKLSISDTILTKEIKRYIKEVDTPSVKPRYPYITIKDANKEIVKYQINYFVNLSFFDYSQIAFFVKIDNLDIPVLIEGMYFLESFLFKPTEKIKLNLKRKYFPKLFEKLINENEIISYTTREVIWELSYKNGKFLGKKIIK